MITKVFAWRLSKSDIKNKGYVLEGYPVTRSEATDIFIERIPLKDEIVDTIEPSENNADSPIQQPSLTKTAASVLVAATQAQKGSAASPPQAGAPPNQSVEQKFELRLRREWVPDKIIQFTVDNGTELLTHMRGVLSEDIQREWRVTPESVDQRLAEYTQKTTPEANSAVDFYKEHKIEVIPLPLKNFETKLKVLDFVGEKIDFSFKEVAVEDPSQESIFQGERPGDNTGSAVERGETKLESDETGGINLDEVKQQEQEILNQKSQALKQYITDNLLPALTSGLIQICDDKPDDPLEKLADYLIKLSQTKSSGPVS